jgi:CheY-like chemotaxis protein
METQRKVLVADNVPYVVELTQSWLTSEGYQVIATTQREEVLRKIKDERPDLIILGLGWPPSQWDKEETWLLGCEVVEILQSVPSLATIPIILLAAKSADPDDLPACRNVAAEVASFLYKPFTREELLYRIDHPSPGDPSQHDLSTQGLQYRSRSYRRPI